jgi:uncharacterized membrane protein YbhN (UPF0104 family)
MRQLIRRGVCTNEQPLRPSASESRLITRYLHRTARVPLRYWEKSTSCYESLSPTKKAIFRDIVIWSIALLCIWWIGRGITVDKLLTIFKDSKLWLFLLVNIVSFFIWWLGDTLLFATLFSFFHKKTSFRELLPATAAQYFLQAINIVAADGALVVFLNRRKGVKWLTATWTLMYQGLIDALCLALTATAAAALAPRSVTHWLLPYLAGVLGFLLLVALWWARGKPITRPEKWMYNRPSAKAFREAGWREYLTLGSIRLSLMVIQGFLNYYSFVAFWPKVPLIPVLALTPAIQAASSEPITPQGLGPLQVVVVAGLSKLAPRDKMLAASLGISIIAILCRLPLGLGAAGTFARKVMLLEATEGKKKQSDESPEQTDESKAQGNKEKKQSAWAVY